MTPDAGGGGVPGRGPHREPTSGPGRGGGEAGERRDLARRLRVMIVTRPEPACGRPLAEVVDACLAAGATAVQLRDKRAPDAELYRRARELARIARRHDALFLVNDRFDVALAAGAHGVHLGPADVPVAAVRSRVPPGFVVGYSTDDPDEGRRAAAHGADYLGVGAVYGTRTKREAAGEAVGPERVGRVLRAAGLPGVGIGGVTPENAGAVAAAGAGVAVVSAVMDAPDPASVTRALRRTVDAGGTPRRASGACPGLGPDDAGDGA